jgi:hypothetical protein
LSGHGYGHFVRSAAVLERVAERADVHVVTCDRALALARAARWACSVSDVELGPGVAQRGPLAIDLEATRSSLARHLDEWPALAQAEAARLGALGASLVFADLPSVAFEIAARAGVPSIGLGNFSWSWIYDGYAAHDRWFAVAAARLREAEARATTLLLLQMGGGLEHFPRTLPVAPVVRRPTADRATLRARLPLPADERPIVLLSFGGFGGELALELGVPPDLRALVVSAPVAVESERLRAIEPCDKLPHQDLVAAVDCVVGKPGYGTVGECLQGPTPFCYVPRGEFREYPALVAAIERWLPSAPLSVEELRAGGWAEAARRAMASRPPERAPGGDGIADATAHILGALGIG